jgi:WD40 repeat protein
MNSRMISLALVTLGCSASRPDTRTRAPNAPPAHATPDASVATGDGVLVLTLGVSNASLPRFSPRGAHFTLCMEDGTVEVRDAVHGHTVRMVHLAETCSAALLRSDERRIIAVGSRGRVRTWPSIAGGGDSEAGFDVGPVEHIALSPDGRLVAVAAATVSGPIRLWSVDERRELGRIETVCEGSGAAGELQALAFGQNGAVLWASCGNGRLTNYDTTTWQPIAPGIQTQQLIAVSDPPGGPLAGVGWNPGNLHRFSAGERAVRSVALGDISRAGFSPDGRLAAISWIDHLALWDVSTMTARAELRSGRTYDQGIAVVSGGDAIVACGGRGEALLWRPGADEGHRTIDMSRGEERPTLRVLGGRRLVVEDFAAARPLLALRTGDPVPLNPTADMAIEQISSDGERLLVATRQTNPVVHRVVRVSDGATLGEVSILSCDDCPEHRRLFASHDLRFLAVAISTTSAECEVHRVQRIDVLHRWRAVTLPPGSSPVANVGFSPDGSRLIVSSEQGHVEVWDVATQRRTASFDVAGEPSSLTPLADGRTMVALRRDGAVDSLDLATGRVTAHIDRQTPGHPGGVFTRFVEVPAAFAHGAGAGARMLFGDERGTWWVWDPTTSRGVGEIFVLGDGSWAARDSAGRVGATPAARERLHIVRGLDLETSPGAVAASLTDLQDVVSSLGLE